MHESGRSLARLRNTILRPICSNNNMFMNNFKQKFVYRYLRSLHPILGVLNWFIVDVTLLIKVPILYNNYTYNGIIIDQTYFLCIGSEQINATILLVKGEITKNLNYQSYGLNIILASWICFYFSHKPQFGRSIKFVSNFLRCMSFTSNHYRSLFVFYWNYWRVTKISIDLK